MAAREPARHISHDPINNLKVRVCLKRVTSTSILQNINSAFANPTSTGSVPGYRFLFKNLILKILRYFFEKPLIIDHYIHILSGQDLEMLPRTEEPGAEEVITISWQVNCGHRV